MTLDQFFEKFELFADAPNAVAKMRELVLELAVQGRLVPQAEYDEPASAQLARIAIRKAEVARPVRAKPGKKKVKQLEVPATSIPPGWSMAPLADLIAVLNGRAYSKDELLEKGTPVLRVGNLFTSKHWYYSNLELDPDKYCDEGDLIFAWSASFGPFIWPGPKAIYHYHIWKLELYSESDLVRSYLYWYLQNKTQEIKRAGHGVSMLHMTKGKMEKLQVMVPPVAEQKRIVAKVDELMALCDRLEAQQQERETKHAALVRASLTRFADAPTPANLQFLFHPSYSIPPADLRKSILTLAVQGKLVPQEQNDESAEEIVDRIARLREHFSSSKRAKLAKKIQDMDETKCVHDVPDTWTWCRFGDLVLDFRYGTSRKCDRNPTGTPVLRIPNILRGRIDATDLKFTNMLSSEFDNLRLQAGDLLLVRSNGSEGLVGRSAVATSKDEQFAYAGYLVRVRIPTDEVFSPFLHVALSTPQIRDQIEGPIRTTSGVKNINTTELYNLVLPLPPLAEQRRIVAKVDELMALVDALEAQLATARTTATDLLAAAVAELTTTD